MKLAVTWLSVCFCCRHSAHSKILNTPIERGELSPVIIIPRTLHARFPIGKTEKWKKNNAPATTRRAEESENEQADEKGFALRLKRAHLLCKNKYEHENRKLPRSLKMIQFLDKKIPRINLLQFSKLFFL